MPDSTRCCCPLHQRPTTPNCSPYLRKTESSVAQVHCQRLCVAALLRHMTPQRHQHRKSQTPQPLEPGAFGQALSSREGQFLSQLAPELRGGAAPKGGEHHPDYFAQELCWLRTPLDLHHQVGYPLKAGQLTYDCRYSTMHSMPVTGGRGFRGLKPLWYNGVSP